MFALCVSVFGPSTWLWVILINVCARLKGRPGAARDLDWINTAINIGILVNLVLSLGATRQ